MEKTLFEQSFEEWHHETKGTRQAWSQFCVAEWARIQASLVASGHWHAGAMCREAKCGEP